MPRMYAYVNFMKTFSLSIKTSIDELPSQNFHLILCKNPTENCWESTCQKCVIFHENSIENCFDISTSNVIEWN